VEGEDDLGGIQSLGDLAGGSVRGGLLVVQAEDRPPDRPRGHGADDDQDGDGGLQPADVRQRT
jgi:hypothetical protein